ncbi:MAG: hypothetical protein LW850_28025 [Planctomycetaceae bacterium]|nr:hypothetical protein [Planctomycetaceae bacterium]
MNISISQTKEFWFSKGNAFGRDSLDRSRWLCFEVCSSAGIFSKIHYRKIHYRKIHYRKIHYRKIHYRKIHYRKIHYRKIHYRMFGAQGFV